MADITLEAWNNVMNINLNSVFFSMKYEIQAILRAGGGAIVNVDLISNIHCFQTGTLLCRFQTAQAILTIANEQTPPLRLLLGSDAVELAN